MEITKPFPDSPRGALHPKYGSLRSGIGGWYLVTGKTGEGGADNYPYLAAFPI